MPDTMIDGIQIHYNETGEGEPLLLIMGYGMPGDAWLGSLPFLNGFHSIYYDNRGTGRSDKPAGRSPRRSRRRAGGAQDHAGAILRWRGRTRDAESGPVHLVSVSTRSSSRHLSEETGGALR